MPLLFFLLLFFLSFPFFLVCFFLFSCLSLLAFFLYFFLPFFLSSLSTRARTLGELRSERYGTTANFALLKDPLFWGTARASCLLVLCKMNQHNISLKNDSKTKAIHNSAHTRCQKGVVPEEAKIGRSITTFVFFTCALGAPMTDYPRNAVSAAEPHPREGWTGVRGP